MQHSKTEIPQEKVGQGLLLSSDMSIDTKNLQLPMQVIVFGFIGSCPKCCRATLDPVALIYRGMDPVINLHIGMGSFGRWTVGPIPV